MGCCGEREKFGEGTPEQRWDYINLSDFKPTSCFAPLSYGVLYISLLISVAVYVVDTWTAANLLFFNRWSGQVQPIIPFDIARWIFAGCIMLSWILLVYRWLRAIRVMRSGIVAASYLDPLAVRVQSIRMGKNGRGWRRFLLFADLTKGRKGAEYIALFAFFSFEAWLRILFAEGPRQIINAITLYTVMKANLIPEGQHAASGGKSPIAQFFVNVRILADANNQQAAILFGMLFTLIIWVFAAFGLILACLFYVIFLWHHIPSLDGTLARYCRRKVDKRLAQIVGVKIKRAIEREDRQWKGDSISNSRLKHQPTLPILDDDKVVLSRQTTQSTLSQNGPQSPLDPVNPFGGEEHSLSALPGLNRPLPPSRLASQSSAHSVDSYTSDAPLISNSNTMRSTVSRQHYSPAPLQMGSDRSFPHGRPNLSRLVTQESQRSHTSRWISSTPNAEHTGRPNGYTFSGSQPQSRKAVPRANFHQDSYEMESSSNRSQMISPASTAYTAFHPSMRTLSQQHNNPYNKPQHYLRSATAPPLQQNANQYGSRPSREEPEPGQVGFMHDYSRHTKPTLLRSGTAPIDRLNNGAAWTG